MEEQVSCEKWMDKLVVRHLEDLSEQDRQDLANHLSTCSECAAVSEAYQMARTRLQDLPVARPFPSLFPILQTLWEPSSTSRVFSDQSEPNRPLDQPNLASLFLDGQDEVENAEIVLEADPATDKKTLIFFEGKTDRSKREDASWSHYSFIVAIAGLSGVIVMRAAVSSFSYLQENDGFRFKMQSGGREIARFLNDQTGISDDQRDYEQLARRILEMCLQQLGSAFHQTEGMDTEVEPSYRRVLEGNTLQLPDMALSLDNRTRAQYAAAHFAGLLGTATEVESLYRPVQENTPQLPDVVLSLENLANLYQVHGEHALAELLYQWALVISEERLGSAHPDTRRIRSSYASFLKTLGRDEEADELEKQT